MPRGLFSLALALAACMSEGEGDQPLSPLMIRQNLAGRTVLGYENGRQLYMYLAPNGVAVRYEEIAEYGQWRVDGARGLCLYWHEEGERCAPVYQIHVGRYRFGDIEVNASPGPVGGYSAGGYPTGGYPSGGYAPGPRRGRPP